MLLLALALIKDAAKAVKRICKEAFTEVHDSVLTELLGISMLKVTMFCLRCEGDEDVLHLWCVHLGSVAICTRCGMISEDGVYDIFMGPSSSRSARLPEVLPTITQQTIMAQAFWTKN